MKKYNMIGVGSCARVGKDTFFNIFSNILKDYGVTCERVALADLLKSDVDKFCKEKYGISAFTKDPVEKEIIRYLLVSHGKIMRKLTKGRHWTSKVQPIIDNYISEGKLVVCTDIRFAEFDFDEINWLKEVNNGTYIHINRFDANGNKFKPVNEEEERNEKPLEKMADFKLNWSSSPDLSYLTDTVKLQLNDLLLKLCPNYQV